MRRFEKVSIEEYCRACQCDKYYTRTGIYSFRDMSGVGEVSLVDRFSTLKEYPVEEIYKSVCLPKRATRKSAGYDIYAPYDFTLNPGESIDIATGIRVCLDDDKFLLCVPRSGHGFKARIQLDNTVGVIDADYADSLNEGHIRLKLTNDSRTGKTIKVTRGEGMAQAIILAYFTVDDEEEITTDRNGGFGSTNKI